MARIAGIDLPREKRVEIALTYIFGIGRKSANLSESWYAARYIGARRIVG